MVRPRLIPASENINDGVAALGKYHQPVRITGFLVESQNRGSPVEESGVVRTTSKYQRIVLQIPEIKTLLRSMSLSQRSNSLTMSSASTVSKDEHLVPFLGRAGSSVPPCCWCGCSWRHMYSSLRLRMSARSIALTLLGKEGVKRRLKFVRT